MKQVKQITFAARPSGLPDESIFRIDEAALPDAKEGELQLRGMFYSVDPYMRGRMNDAKSYVPPFQVGQALEGGVVAEVVSSRANGFDPGDVVLGPYLPWRTEMTVPATAVQKIDANIAPPSYYLGVLGMTGLTAYIGLMDIGRPKAGETVVVSGAAGAVGSVVGQIAKHLGCRAVGIAGSDEKGKLLTETFGFDAAINYNEPGLDDRLSTTCPNGVDIYFDNVGGEISDAVMKQLNFFARVPLCGQISMYNATEPPTGPRWQGLMVTRSILMQGFIIRNYVARFREGIEFLAPLVKAGKIKSEETVAEGFEKLPEALLGLFSGKNKGKMIVKA